MNSFRGEIVKSRLRTNEGESYFTRKGRATEDSDTAEGFLVLTRTRSESASNVHHQTENLKEQSLDPYPSITAGNTSLRFLGP